ncbi:glycosyltransferase [uncultured Cytophaga sp.]|uniref:glycosyltransferase family 2 protein n=1 Tax=uncultured Cytophaga sp. TaxID=160238 RepID=UPI002609990D|nr:glycosyltransferase [uncultured Cytophaga sp.]
MDGKRRPLVTIIAISYNHAPFIQEALYSIFNQSYSNIELIVIDDASTDTSCQVIESCITGRSILFLKNEKNIGNCTSFNKAYKHATGDYIIDFALDDIMYATRIEKQVAFFQNESNKVGVIFTNVDIVSENGSLLYTHYPTFHHRSSITNIPSGDVFEALLSQYYINPVSMMSRREVFDKLNGYDECLAYEDFDFWIRSARIFEYAYMPEILSAKRTVTKSLSSQFYQANQLAMFESTLNVCKKAWWLCTSAQEKQALVKRCRYEARQAFTYKYKNIVGRYLEILKEIDPMYVVYRGLVKFFIKLK